jgi:hypothetical protein
MADYGTKPSFPRDAFYGSFFAKTRHPAFAQPASHRDCKWAGFCLAGFGDRGAQSRPLFSPRAEPLGPLVNVHRRERLLDTRHSSIVASRKLRAE